MARLRASVNVRHCTRIGFVWDVFGRGKCLPIFCRGLMCMCRVYNVGCLDVSLGVGMRHLESPEEIQMYRSDSQHIYHTVYEVHMYIYMLGYK